MQLETENLPEGGVLIIGAGVAGLFTALKLAPLPVTIITAAPVGRGGSSTWAQGGLAAAMAGDDNPHAHFEDTVAAGAGLVDHPPTHILTTNGPARVQDLIDLGVAFDTDEDGRLKLGREAAHSRNRIVHAKGDQAGAAIMDALITAADQADHITIRERIVAEDILLTGNGQAGGVLGVDVLTGERLMITCPRVVLSTGGLGGLYAITTNPKSAQGHGIAMALRAGADILDAEFVQFHPTALDIGKDPAPLATEALRGDGAILVDKYNDPIMKTRHPDGDLAPRDIVARGVAAAIADGRSAFLDASDAIGADFGARYPTVFKACMEEGINPATDPMPVAPAVHYHMGGVATDTDGRTAVPGLWAVGEVAATGVHGANRLASNSLLEALVFGARAAINIQGDKGYGDAGGLFIPRDRLQLPPKPSPHVQTAMLRNVMAEHAGILRTKSGLMTAMEKLTQLEQAHGLTSGLQNALLAATVVLVAALDRRESRGSHQRLDYQSEATPVHSVVSWHPEKGLKVGTRPVDKTG